MKNDTKERKEGRWWTRNEIKKRKEKNPAATRPIVSRGKKEWKTINRMCRGDRDELKILRRFPEGSPSFHWPFVRQHDRIEMNNPTTPMRRRRQRIIIVIHGLMKNINEPSGADEAWLRADRARNSQLAGRENGWSWFVSLYMAIWPRCLSCFSWPFHLCHHVHPATNNFNFFRYVSFDNIGLVSLSNLFYLFRTRLAYFISYCRIWENFPSTTVFQTRQRTTALLMISYWLMFSWL